MKETLIKNPFYSRKKESCFFEIIITSLVVGLVVGFIATIIFISEYKISDEIAEGPSMKPTFDEKVHLYINSTSRVLNSLTYNDIVYFTHKETDYVKRIIGLPGDLVEIKDKKLYINGVYIEEDFIIPDTSNTPTRKQLRDDEYFVMGDNRADSDDSRYVTVGTVHKSQIVGRVFGGESCLSSSTYNFIEFYN